MIHLRDLLISRVGFTTDYSSVKSQLLKDLKKKGCTYHPLSEGEGGMIEGWDEESIPPYAPYNHSELLDRLNGQVFEFEGKAFTTCSRIELSGRIYTTLHSEDGEACFQSMKPNKRSLFTWKGMPLERFDVSASQLRIALALRGQVLPFDKSPWDELKVEHSALDTLSSKDRRKIIKQFALFRVREQNNPDVKKAWRKELGKEAHLPPLGGLKKAIWDALEAVYPVLKKPFPLPYRTPDGYLILREEREVAVAVKSDLLGINTTHLLPMYEAAQASNVLEAIEAYILREVIRSIPKDAPILTCHDEIVTLAESIYSIKKEWHRKLKSIDSEFVNFYDELSAQSLFPQ